jgi:hypothetical protein
VLRGPFFDYSDAFLCLLECAAGEDEVVGVGVGLVAVGGEEGEKVFREDVE